MADRSFAPNGRAPFGWSALESEVAHYIMHEPGAASANLEPQGGSKTGEPNPPRFPIGAQYIVMMTAWSRFVEADKIMPYVNCVELRRPSCLMTLRAAYGQQACRYDDQAPNGAKLLWMAQEAYILAAKRVPWWPKRDPQARTLARYDRHFGLVGPR